MHRRTSRGHSALLFWIVASAGLAACAAAPPQRTETAAIHDLRADYFRTYPEGPNNDHIRRGEVVRGMSLYEVLASWGIPDARVVAPEQNKESWIYVVQDDLSLDWIAYEYEFRSNALVEWTTTRNVANGLPLDSPDLRRDPLTLPAWASSSQRTGPPVR
ncbi:MAG TPA: hypothetical protein VF247_06680 [Candidatus Krumholzibacteria bacterium]